MVSCRVEGRGLGAHQGLGNLCPVSQAKNPEGIAEVIVKGLIDDNSVLSLKEGAPAPGAPLTPGLPRPVTQANVRGTAYIES